MDWGEGVAGAVESYFGVKLALEAGLAEQRTLN